MSQKVLFPYKNTDIGFQSSNFWPQSSNLEVYTQLKYEYEGDNYIQT